MSVSFFPSNGVVFSLVSFKEIHEILVKDFVCCAGLVDGFCCLGDMLGVGGMLVRLWRLGFELDGMDSGGWCHCLPVGMYR